MLNGYLSAKEYAALKGAFRKLVRTVGGPTHAAEIARVSQQQISRYMSASTDHERQFPALDVIADLEAECGQPIVTRALADNSDCILVPLPRGTGLSELAQAMGAASKEHGDVLVALGQALVDGKLDERESAEVESEINEAIVTLGALRELVREKAGAVQ